MAEARKETRLEEQPPKEIYYFGYGPIVNDLVRQRREIETIHIEAAYVPDYRLTFAFGGNANIVRKTGFETHGLLMKLKSPEDWEKIRKFEAGNAPSIRTVIPYSAMASNNTDDDDEEEDDYNNNNNNNESEDDSQGGTRTNADTDFLSHSLKGSVQAYLIEMPENADDTLLDAPIERLPQERYLKLIASGMRQYGVDEDYICDHIEACPFIPNRKPEEYFTFPVAKKVRKISLNKYQELCAKAKAVEGDLYFCLGKSVFRVGEHDPANPLAKWFEAHGHGKPCCTYMVHLTVVDPAIPLLFDAKDVTPAHIAWAENHLSEVIKQYGLGSATRVYELTMDGGKDEDMELSEDSSLASGMMGRRRRSCWKWLLCPFRGLRDGLKEELVGHER